MANRSFQRLQALDKEIKIIHGQFVTDSTAASTASLLTNSKSVGVKAVYRVGAGHFRIELGTPGGDVDKYSHFFGAYFDIQKSTAIGSTAGGVGFQLQGAPSVSTDGQIDFFSLKSNGDEADPGNSETIHFMVVLKNSSLAGIGV
tara:strand:- start:5317 stop:5751 length:435 start_codon:yes stop_codon:yes gene_type:complete